MKVIYHERPTPGYVRVLKWSPAYGQAQVGFGVPELDSEEWTFGTWMDFRNEADAREFERRWNAHAQLLAACKAALAYDAAIQKRAIDGAVDLMATGGAVAMGDDLDALYAAWIDAARAAVAKADPTTTGG